MQRDIRNLPKLMHQVIDQSGEEGPDLVQLNLIGPDARGEDRFLLAESWREAHPQLLNMIHVPLRELLDESCQHFSVSFGVAVPENRLPDKGLIREPAYRYPSRDCIGTMIRVHDPFQLTREDLQPLFRCAREKRYTFVDSLTSWMITKTHEEGQDWYYFATRVSVQHEKD